MGGILGELPSKISAASTALLGFAAAHPVITGIIAVLGTLGFAIGSAQQQMIQARESAYEWADSQRSLQDTIKNSNYQQLYKEYLDTGEASDSLKQSAIELSDALGIAGGSALAEAGNFEELNSQLATAIERNNELAEASRANERAQIAMYGNNNVLP